MISLDGENADDVTRVLKQICNRLTLIAESLQLHLKTSSEYPPSLGEMIERKLASMNERLYVAEKVEEL